MINKNDSRAYAYQDPFSSGDWSINYYIKSDKTLSDSHKKRIEEKWNCLHTYNIDEEYSRARHPVTEEEAKNNPLSISKDKINELYGEIEKFYDKLNKSVCS